MPLVNEKHRYEKAETKTFDLEVKLRVGPFGMWVDQTKHASGEEGSEDGLKAKMQGQRG